MNYLSDQNGDDIPRKLVARALSLAIAKWHVSLWMSWITIRFFKELVLWVETLGKELVRMMPLLRISMKSIK